MAVHCEVSADEIDVGVLILSDSFTPGTVTLVDVDQDREGLLVAFPVKIPSFSSSINYNVILKRHHEISAK